MPQKNEEIVDILILDIDNCVINPTKLSLAGSHFLSPQLMAFIQEKRLSPDRNIKAYAFCSHRCYYTSNRNIRSKLPQIELQRNSKLAHHEIAPGDFPIEGNDIFLPSVVKNFQEALAAMPEVKTEHKMPEEGLRFLGVSTPDDLCINDFFPKGREFGSGYKDAILPYETDVMRSKQTVKEEKRKVPIRDKIYTASGEWTDYDFVSFKKEEYTKFTVTTFDDDSKNDQIKQIMENAKKEFPQAKTLRFLYVDDKEELLLEATKLKHQKKFFKNMELETFHHDAFREGPVIVYEPLVVYFEDEGMDLSDSPSSLCSKLRNSMQECSTYMSKCCHALSTMSFFRRKPQDPGVALIKIERYQPLQQKPLGPEPSQGQAPTPGALLN